jgi:nucleotide-binding universal stress UspA family protein
MRRLPRTFPVEASITSGSLVPIVLELATRIAADLIVLGSHGSSTDDHTSVAERILGRSSSPVLVIQEGVVSATPLRLRSRPGHAAPEVAVAIDFSNAGSRVLEYALGLARAFGLYLRVLHVEGALVSRRSTAETERRLAEIVPADLAGRVECHVELGDPAERIMNFLRERLPAYAVMGEHARDFVRRFFTRDTARQVLHRAPCPVWFVPPR